MEPKEANNKTTEVVWLQQMLKKWKKLAVAPKSNRTKGIVFLQKTLPFAKTSSGLSRDVPKGFLAVCVGDKMKRFVIPTEYLGHKAFGVILREAEEGFGFQQDGVLGIPCELSVFKSIMNIIERKKNIGYFSSEAESSALLHTQKPMCRR